MSKIARLIIISPCFLLLYNCFPEKDPREEYLSETKGCSLESGTYTAQAVSYDQETGEYEFTLLGTASCFKQPLRLSEVQMQRAPEDAKEKASLDYKNVQEAILLLSSDFKINLIQTVSRPDGTSERSSSGGSWTPFLMSAAAGVAGGMLMNKLMNGNKPQYYTPPAPQPGKRNLSGVGGYGKTPKDAVKSYQRRYPHKPLPASGKLTQNKKSFFKKKSPSQGFFKRKSSNSKRSRFSKTSRRRSGFFRLRGGRRR